MPATLVCLHAGEDEADRSSPPGGGVRSFIPVMKRSTGPKKQTPHRPVPEDDAAAPLDRLLPRELFEQWEALRGAYQQPLTTKLELPVAPQDDPQGA